MKKRGEFLNFKVDFNICQSAVYPKAVVIGFSMSFQDLTAGKLRHIGVCVGSVMQNKK